MRLYDGRAHWASTGTGYVLADAGTTFIVRSTGYGMSGGGEEWTADKLDPADENLSRLGVFHTRLQAADACLSSVGRGGASHSFESHVCGQCGRKDADSILVHGKVLCPTCMPQQSVAERGVW